MRRTDKREIFETSHEQGKIRNKNLKNNIFIHCFALHHGGTKISGTVPVLREQSGQVL